MIKLDEQSLSYVVGGTKGNDTRNEDFMNVFRKFPQKTYETMSSIITGKDSDGTENSTYHRAGEATGMAVMAITAVGLWETVKVILE